MDADVFLPHADEFVRLEGEAPAGVLGDVIQGCGEDGGILFGIACIAWLKEAAAFRYGVFQEYLGCAAACEDNLQFVCPGQFDDAFGTARDPVHALRGGECSVSFDMQGVTAGMEGFDERFFQLQERFSACYADAAAWPPDAVNGLQDFRDGHLRERFMRRVAEGAFEVASGKAQEHH